MIPAGVLLYQDDTGQDARPRSWRSGSACFRGRPALGTFLVMFAILNVAYFVYGAGVRGDPWSAAPRRRSRARGRIPEAKVYDPQGFYEKAGQPGPYFSGHLDRLGVGAARRTPDVTPPADGGRCSPKHN